jgi:hypothetical protein
MVNTNLDMRDIYIPTPPSAERLIEIEQEHQEALQKIYDECDDKIVEAKLYYFKDTRGVKQKHNMLCKANGRPFYSADEEKCWGSAIVIGTELQRCKDNTILNITATYSYNLTEEMLKMYEDNNRQLIITK